MVRDRERDRQVSRAGLGGDGGMWDGERGMMM